MKSAEKRADTTDELSETASPEGPSKRMKILGVWVGIGVAVGIRPKDWIAISTPIPMAIPIPTLIDFRSGFDTEKGVFHLQSRFPARAGIGGSRRALGEPRS